MIECTRTGCRPASIFPDISRFVVFDVETPNRLSHRMSAIGITIIDKLKIINCFYSLVNPETYFDYFNTMLTGIDDELVADAPTFPEIWQKIEPIMSSGILVAHNAVFDLGVLKKCLDGYGIYWRGKADYLCTVQMGRRLLPNISHKLNVLCDYYGISLDHHHAASDSKACAKILLHYIASGANPHRYLKTYPL